MKELFDLLPKSTKRNLIFLDTCFFIDVFTRHKEHELAEFSKVHKVAMTSFNVEEAVHVLKKVKDKSVKERVRTFLKNKPQLFVVDIDVHPGEWEREKSFVNEIDPFLAQDVPDASDAVLIATAIRTGSVVLTKDKHDLFTVVLEQYLSRWGLKVVKNFKDV